MSCWKLPVDAEPVVAPKLDHPTAAARADLCLIASISHRFAPFPTCRPLGPKEMVSQFASAVIVLLAIVDICQVSGRLYETDDAIVIEGTLLHSLRDSGDVGRYSCERKSPPVFGSSRWIRQRRAAKEVRGGVGQDRNGLLDGGWQIRYVFERP